MSKSAKINIKVRLQLKQIRFGLPLVDLNPN